MAVSVVFFGVHSVGLATAFHRVYVHHAHYRSAQCFIKTMPKRYKSAVSNAGSQVDSTL